MEVPPGMEDITSISGHASQHAVYGVCVAFTIIMALIVIARLCTRFFIAKQTGLDDLCIALAGVFSLMYCITTYNQAHQGMGLHVWDPAIDKVTMSLFFWAALWSYYAGLGFTKLSILLQYLRIFPQVAFRKICYVLIGITVAWTLWAVFSSMIMCVPVSLFWTTDDFFHDPKCLPRLETWYANAAINLVSDLVTALLPIGVIRSLEIPKRQKHLLYLVFCVGLITCLISALRLIFIYPMTKNLDQTWHSPMFSIWSAVELNVAIYCSCAPTLKGLIQRVWPQFLASMGSRYASARGSGRGNSGREASDASGSTAVNSTTTSSSQDSIRKPHDISEVESQTVEKPTSGFLGFRRSLFKPFSSGTNSSLASCYGGSRDSDEDILFENVTPTSTRKGSSTPSKMHQEKVIEVQTVVDQYVEPRPAALVAAETHKTGVGAGDKSPFEDDQEERDIQKAAWSS